MALNVASVGLAYFKRNLPAMESLRIPNAVSMSEVPELLLFHVSKQGFSASGILREMSKK